jgi:sugar-specific transcriptional regulator TrmB
MTLHKLIDRGFVSYIKEGKRNIYQATNPRHIINYIDEKKSRFEQLLPQLLIKQHGAVQSVITTFKGGRAIKELLYELLEAGGKEHHTIGSSEKALIHVPNEWWFSYHAKRAARGIKAKLIFYESLRWVESEKHLKKAEIRYTKKGFEPLTETIIRNDKVAIIIWADIPLGILIHQKEVADSYEEYFQLLWAQAKEKN